MTWNTDSYPVTDKNEELLMKFGAGVKHKFHYFFTITYININA
jgi:hypothetical protein